MSKSQFIGTWQLVSSEFRRSDGAIIYPYGQDAIGMIIYDAAGNMAAQMMRINRPAFASSDLYQGTPEETKAAFDSCITYFGRYDVDEGQGVVTHHTITHPICSLWSRSYRDR